MNQLANWMRRYRRTAFERVGNLRYSRPALNGLDMELDSLINMDGGIFIEAGANDGYTQSNTYYLEAVRGWTGLLIEPVPFLASECRLNRPRSKIAQVALVPRDFGDRMVTVSPSGLTSTVDGAFGGGFEREDHHRRGLEVQNLHPTPPIEVPVRTLSDLIDDFLGSVDIDLLVLDVEGYELDALRGLDLDRHTPRFACIECRNRESVAQYLAPRMRPIRILHDNTTYADVLFARDELLA